MTNVDDAEVSMRVNGSTITVTYWVLQDDEELTYEKVRFCQNEFDQLALLGDPDSFNRVDQSGLLYNWTPELINIGSFSIEKYIDSNYAMNLQTLRTRLI